MAVGFQHLLTTLMLSFKVLSINQAGFCKKLITTIVVNYINNGDFCASLFFLSKAVDHETLLHRLRSVGLSIHAIPWFKNHLRGRTQCVQVNWCDSLEIAKVFPKDLCWVPFYLSFI